MYTIIVHEIVIVQKKYFKSFEDFMVYGIQLN